MEHDAWFFVGVFVFIFLIWIVTGGPVHPLAFSGPSLAEPGALGGGTYLTLPSAPLGGGRVSLPGSSDGQSVSANTAVQQSPAVAIPSLVGNATFGDMSPYRGVVLMNHYVSSAGSADPKNEYIEIGVAQNASVPVDISGWTLKSDASSNSAMIPRGTETPTSGTVNAAQDIILTAGERAIISSGQSPIGASFKENKCIGYFSTFQQFYPQLPQNCPTPSDELTSNYGSGYIGDASCIDYVNKLSRCQVVLSPPVTVSGSCQSFLVKYLNYNGCMAAHKSDADFKGTVWHVYLGRTTPLWRNQHELVKLLDINGKTVDAFSY